MLKIAGIILILSGTAGGIFSWISEEKKCVSALYEWRQFYIRAYYAMEMEHMQIVDFLKEYPAKIPAMQEWLKVLVNALLLNTYASGEEAFLWSLEQTRELWNMQKECWEVITRSSKGLFGMNLEENLTHLRSAREAVEECIQEQKLAYMKKRKLVIPVTMFGAVMIIICLL